MKYFTTIYKLYTEDVIGEKEVKLMEMYCDDTFLDACNEAETEIEWAKENMKGSAFEKYIRGYRYEIVGLDGSTYVKEIEC